MLASQVTACIDKMPLPLRCHICRRPLSSLLLLAILFASGGSWSAAGEMPPAERPAMATAARPAHWAQPVDFARNLYRIQPGLYRSQRLERDDIPLLNDLGVRTVINLRAFHSDEAILAGTGMHSIDIPVLTWDIRDKHVIAALAAIQRSLPRGAVLIHCQHGADRTGLVSAMHRIIFQQWDREEALRELTDGGYGHHRIWRNIPRYIREADIAQLREAIQAKLPPAADDPTPLQQSADD